MILIKYTNQNGPQEQVVETWEEAKEWLGYLRQMGAENVQTRFPYKGGKGGTESGGGPPIMPHSGDG